MRCIPGPILDASAVHTPPTSHASAAMGFAACGFGAVSWLEDATDASTSTTVKTSPFLMFPPSGLPAGSLVQIARCLETLACLAVLGEHPKIRAQVFHRRVERANRPMRAGLHHAAFH